MLDLSLAALISGLFISSLGTAMFVWGKNQEDFLALGAGFGLAVMPLLVSSVLVLWLLTAAALTGLVLYRKLA